MLNAENEINHSKLENSSEKPSVPENATEDAQEDASVAGSSGAKPNAEDSDEPPADSGRSLQAVLHSLPQAELRLLCSLLAHDGYGVLTRVNYSSNSIFVSSIGWLATVLPF
jgi:E3 ubiquitin-protein ligase HUWE1